MEHEKLAVTLPAEFETNLKGIGRLESLERILEFTGMTDKFTETEVNAMANEKNDHYVQVISKLTQDDILPVISQLLTDLKAHEVKLVVASASKNAPFILKNLGLFATFDAIVDPAKVAHGKPAPDIF
ncbi:Beta-phosphoglucomutase glucose-1-phosphate phosphodismutase [Ligilactobacillus equi DSM 15833 = JCM 10991]|uniref:Beta-phosphoglucomutase glucose-1-phosphate phosphodismutase n=1 Tax=Ligilactobacillus equi DSM 15833 = JCM 10991 TaxID=1423740 RepID=A0A0R1TNZ8_9LACO|nr:Beta-phosphoglucomutase glucose-1-phosphate phosphodismutase [Ligilactobacillus equi DSM 15833 = JCM 10991]